jgi:hypothetical protein
MSIYVNKSNQQLGPFEEAKVLEMLRFGQLSPEDLVIRQGQNQWQQAGTMFRARGQSEQQSNNAAHVNPLNFSNQPVVNWARQNFADITEVKLKFNSPTAKIILALFIFCLPIALTILTVVQMVLVGYTSQTQALLVGSGFLFLLFAAVGAFALLIGSFSRRKIVRFFDAEGAETRNKTKYRWEDLQYLNYRKFHVSRVNLLAALVQTIMFAGSSRVTIELIFSNGKAILPPLMLNQQETHALLGTIQLEHKCKE